MKEEIKISELFAQRAKLNEELEARLNEQLTFVVDAYVQAFGSNDGMVKFCDYLTKNIAPNKFPGGWAGLVKHFNKISG